MGWPIMSGNDHTLREPLRTGLLFPCPLKPPRLHGTKCGLGERSHAFVQAGEALVPGVSAHIAGVNLLDDDGDLVDAETIVEEHAGHVAPGPFGITGDQLPPG